MKSNTGNSYKQRQQKRKLKQVQNEIEQIQQYQSANQQNYLYCHVCYTNKCTFNYRCQFCMICDSCQDKWMAEQIDKQSNNPTLKSVDQLKLNCSGCTKPYTKLQLDQMFAAFPTTSKSLMKFYIKRDNQYQNCPISNCDYIGWTSKDCKTLTCNKCNIQWEKGSNIPSSLKQMNFSELFTKLFKLFLTKNCPKCTAPIQKVGGCKKVRCTNCDNYFCWKCKEAGHYTFSFYCFMICLFSCLLCVLPFNYLLYYYGVYNPALTQFKEFFTVDLQKWSCDFDPIEYF
ncbi:hypothetical protein ABPG73_011339 [Tetrahymena malaccensis]